MTRKLTLAALEAASNRLFGIAEGELESEARFEPLVSYRKLLSVVAHDAGFSYGQIDQFFGWTHSRASFNAKHARALLRQERQWWLDAKANLIDAWEEEGA